MALLHRIHHVELRVRDMSRSTSFYRDVFGLRCSDAATSDGEACCRMIDPARDDDGFSIVLVQGLPAGAELSGMDHVSFEVAERSEIDAVYERALRHQARATTPRVRGGFYQAYVFDPTGYKIEVVARDCEPRSESC